MTTSDGRDLMLQRHEIVMRIMAINSRRLHLDNEIHGLDIERLIAERDASGQQDAGAVRPLPETCEKLAALRAECSKIDVERTWLEQALTEFDSGAGTAPKNGSA